MLEETDTFGYMDDYTSKDKHNLAAFSFEAASDEEDDDAPRRYITKHWGALFLVPHHI